MSSPFRLRHQVQVARAAATVLLVVACASGVTWAAAPVAAPVAVSDAWVRGTVGAQTATGAFMTLTASADTELVAVATPAANTAELHEMKMDGGVMKMRPVASIPLPAGKPVQLSPGGFHVMLVGLTSPLPPEQAVTLTLTFRDKAGVRTTQEVRASVRPLTAGNPGRERTAH
jgi:copper(I)-binding protein